MEKGDIKKRIWKISTKKEISEKYKNSEQFKFRRF